MRFLLKTMQELKATTDVIEIDNGSFFVNGCYCSPAMEAYLGKVVELDKEYSLVGESPAWVFIPEMIKAKINSEGNSYASKRRNLFLAKLLNAFS